MANLAGFGLVPVRSLAGGELRIRPYNVPSSDGTALYKGDVVKLNSGLDTASQLPTIVAAASTNTITGVIVGFLPDPTTPYNASGYRTASTSRTVLVCDDPNAVYQILEDANGGVVSAAHVGAMYYATLNIVAGSTSTGVSGTMLASTSAQSSSSGMDVRIIGVDRVPGNVAAQAAGAILEVTLVNPLL